MSEPKKILIIDDEPLICTTISAYFTRKGFEVHSAHTCWDGLNAAEKILPDVILLDLDLPDRSGLEFAGLGEIFPVILISGKVEMPEDVARRLNTATFVKKPVDMDVLLKKIEEVLDVNAALTVERIVDVLLSFDVMKACVDGIKQRTGVNVTPQEITTAMRKGVLSKKAREIVKGMK